MKNLLSLLVLTLFLFASSKGQSHKSEEENIIRCWRDWPKKDKTGNLDSIGYYWAEDAIAMGQGQPTLKGKEAIMKVIGRLHQNPNVKIKWDDTPSGMDFSKDGQMAYLFAKNTISITDSTGTIRSQTHQAIEIWKKDKKGNWKAAVVFMYPEK
jgi:ketosteroid isomerase-like protein